MTVLEIRSVGDPCLRKVAQAVTLQELQSEGTQRFIDDLIETMRDAKGAGLAATQVGVMKRICVIEVGDNPRYPYKPKIPLRVLVDPVLTPITEERFANYEGCLSVPNLRGVVSRVVGIRLQARDRKGTDIDEEVWGLSAGTYQHECDHLNGKLFLDRVEDTSTLATWEMFDKHHKAKFVKRVEALVTRFGS